jgi:hypothetical protein
MSIAPKQDAKIIKPADDTLQLDAVDEKDRQGCFVLAHVVEKRVLQILSFFCRHVYFPFFIERRETPLRFGLLRRCRGFDSRRG